ncbi:hypothetical protein HDU84_000227 [Entophlyctis sp. JEL0112]|nr:hypothetical protein HDU84_000227 [Entophlyctis sp. JEL0112]
MSAVQAILSLRAVSAVPWTRLTSAWPRASVPVNGFGFCRHYARLSGSASSTSYAPRSRAAASPSAQYSPPGIEETGSGPVVTLPRESSDDVIKLDHPHISSPASVLAHAGLMVGRQLEMMNVLIGYEQANKYAITDHNGSNVGFIAEEEQSFVGTILRQVMGTRRSFNAVVLDSQGEIVLRISRPVKWFLNSEITVTDKDGKLIGSVQQNWHFIRRKYDLFVQQKQFAIIDSPFLSWNFAIEDEDGGVLSVVNRSFGGFARELFTDTGVYAIHLDILPPSRPVSLDERAVILACAINVDIDYFSQHSNSHGGILPFLFIGSAMS